MNDEQLIQSDPTGYELRETLGQGGFGTVYLARQQSTGQTVAVKMLRLDDTSEEERARKVERFDRETCLCADLQHPNIVRLLDKGTTEDNHLYAVFEYVQGETLRDLLIREGTLPAMKAGELMGQVLDGLICAHEQGIVHRDLKPANIMITPAGTRQHVKILDFGIGTFVPDARKADYTSLTLSKETVGTPSYSAPEQLRGEPPTVKSDLYAWGLVFLECLTGRAVMKGMTLAEIFHKQLSPDDVILPSAILGHPLGDLLRRVLQKSHNDRTGKTEVLYSDFQKINLSSIVGNLNTGSADSFTQSGNTQVTETISPWPLLHIERRQITVLCCSLGLMPVGDATEPNFEAIDALQRDLLSLCSDTGARYGAFTAGSLGDTVMMFFGYPQAGDNDARHAARTALDLAVQIRRRSALLVERQGIRPAFRMGIHSGMVTTCAGTPPSGITSNTALKLQNYALPGTVLVSNSTRSLLERYIEFEPSESYSLDRPKPEQTFLLTGERQDEAFTFLQTGTVKLPMVGRNTEFNLLKTQWETVLKKQGGAALLKGEAGIGKSRLIHKIRGFISDSGYQSIVIRCLPEHRNSGLYPVFEMLKSKLNLNEASPEEAVSHLEIALKTCRCDIEWSMPIICSWLSMPIPEKYPSVPHSPERQKMILLEVLEELILNMAEERPMMFIAEDMHWGDQVTQELLNQLMVRINETSVLMLLTARPEFSTEIETEALTLIELSGLSRPDAEEMIQKLSGDRPIHQDVLEAVYTRTDGVPLFIEELVRLMLYRQHIVEKNGMYHMNETFDSASVPITLQDLLNEKLGRLGPAKETAQTAAVIGREFDYSLLAQVSLLDEASVQTNLDQMTEAGLIYRQRRVQGASYIFRHALIRDSAYNSMVQSVRSQAHGRVAITLENDFPDLAKADPAGIANHFAEAGIFEKAVSYGTSAANTALGRSLNDVTIVHANKVLEWIEQIDADKRPEFELDINEILTQALMGKFGWAAPEVKARIDRSRNLLDQMEHSSHQFPTLWALAMYHHVAGNRKEVRSITARLSDIATKSKDQGFQVASDMLIGHSLYIEGNYTKAAEKLKRAISNYDPEINTNNGVVFGFDTRVWALSTMANIWLFTGNTEKAKECGKQATEWAHKVNHTPSLGIALLYRGMVFHFLNDRTEASVVSGELISESKKYGLPAYEGYGGVIHSWGVGNGEMLQSILKMLRQMGIMLGLTQYDSLYADIEADKGRYKEAVVCIDDCIKLCHEIGEYYYEPELYLRRAYYLLKIHTDGNEEIKADLIKAIELARHQSMFRTEAYAIHNLIRCFGNIDNYQARLDEIIALSNDLSILTA